MEIQEIKERLSIVQVLAYYGLKMNRNKHICCPFHEDKTPSMRVYEETNTVYCFSGNCRLEGKSLDVIEFVQQKEGCSKHEAILKCKELLGFIPKVTVKKELLEQIWEDLKASFKRNGKKAQSYAKNRGLEGIELGYNAGRWHLGKHRTEAERAGAKELGFLLTSRQTESKATPWGKECIIFPLRSNTGKVVSFYGRSVSKKGHYYMKDRSGLYPAYPSKQATRIILVESVIDAASLLGIKELKDYEVLALYGTNGYTTEHKKALQSCGELEEVILMLDGDEAGQKANKKLSEQLQKELPQSIIKEVSLPENTDVNELWANHLSGELFKELLENATVASRPVEAEIKPSLDLQIVNERYYLYNNEQLKIEVLGGIAIEQLDRMQCTLRVTRKPQRNALDKIRQNLNLYHAGQVKGLVSKLHEQLEIPLQNLRLIIADLTEQLEAYRTQEQAFGGAQEIRTRQVPAARRRKALDYLKSPVLMAKTWTDLSQVGIVGERENALIMYLCFSSRKLKKPLHVISLGSSGSGKTHLQEVIAGLMPEEEVLFITSLSDQALYYYPKDSLIHKLFLVEDLDGMSEDAQYALRELKSKGRLSKYVPIKDQKGKSITGLVEVEGPICFGGCTTRERVYEDNANRCILLYRDESKGHKQAVMEEQRRAAAGKVNELAQKQLREQFKDVQTLLKPIKVVNPYAEQLALPSRVFKPLRTNAHYLQFIEVITFYHQHQREEKTSQSGTKYIETTIEDIEWANKLMKNVLLSKSDELSWGVRDFLEKLKGVLKKHQTTTFTSPLVRDSISIKPRSLSNYLRQLVEYGHLKILSGNRYRGFEYELLKPEEYEELKADLDNALDKNLEKIKS
ncbi:MAG: toprim domain-containing protein [Aureispira sp.]